MPAKKLSDAFVRSVKFDPFTKIATRGPNAGKEVVQTQVSYLDSMERGLTLELLVGARTKTFRMVTYRGGKMLVHKLGTYPGMKLAQAREQAYDRWRNPEKYEVQDQTGTYKDVAEDWVKRHVDAKGLRSKTDIERLLKRYVYPTWKDRPFLEIRRHEVNKLLDQIAEDHGPSQADAVLAIIRGIANWYQARDEHYTSPIVRGMKRHHAQARNRILDDDEIRAVWKAAAECGQFGSMVKVLLLTGQRRAKVATIEHTNVNEDGVWIIARAPREKANAGELQLPQQVLDIINKQPVIEGNPYVFAGVGKTAFNHWSEGMATLRAKLPKGMPRWTIHDLRRTARSLMARADVRPDIAERVLGHTIPGVEGVYDRHEYGPHKADALKRLAALIDMIISPPKGNVVALADRHASDRREAGANP